MHPDLVITYEAGVGIVTGSIIAIDIDIQDGELASRIERLARQLLGDTPLVRIGLPPKRLLVYRSAEPLKGLRAHPLEALGLGQQFVAFADHPDTRKPYQWPVESPADLPAEQLPAVDEAMVRVFLDEALRAVPGELRPGALPGARERADQPGQAAAGDLRGTPDAIADALPFIPNADLDYDSWLRVGLALILQVLFDEAAAGRMYTSMQFAERFENQAGLGAERTIRDRISVLATKGWIKFVRNYKDYGLPAPGPSKLGFLCVEDMVLGPIKEIVDGGTGEVTELGKPVRPSDFKCPQTGALLPVENPEDWVYQEDDPG